MTLRELYSKLHGNYNEACQRLINETMASRFVIKFLNDSSMQNLRNAVAAGDIEKSFRSVHTLKGVSANLAFTDLYNTAWTLTEHLRSRQQTADPVMLEALEKEYARTVALIEEFRDSQQ